MRDRREGIDRLGGLRSRWGRRWVWKWRVGETWLRDCWSLHLDRGVNDVLQGECRMGVTSI